MLLVNMYHLEVNITFRKLQYYFKNSSVTEVSFPALNSAFQEKQNQNSSQILPPYKRSNMPCHWYDFAV